VSAALELRHVSKTRGRGPHATAALIDAWLGVEPGEVVLLHGPSGSGKTTLLGIAAGLLTPDRGEVALGGELLYRDDPAMDRRRRAQRIGFVFQRANLLPGLSVRDNVLVQAALAGLERPAAIAEADELLAGLGLERHAARRPSELSGGEEQRVAVARALVHRPALVLADEPTAMLDGASGRAVAERLSSLARARGTAVVIATHDARLDPYGTRTVRIADGRIEPRP